MALSDLNGIDVFVATVQAGNFSQAAETRQVTRSAVAKSIARLEARLGTPLFQRTTRSQRLTEAEAIYFEHCLRAMEEIRSGEATLKGGRT
ncbi:LysR family transcriptional regulator [Stenotrophomonas sp. 59]|uniref:LysR family transcriptional regulator n=1 Tax=Stenotrophomonas sp. 59 TaxID=3051120 RepID=UPI00256ECBE1|nr:LysR family transcriptional regulator [Stenotrophomonas sp. 59]